MGWSSIKLVMGFEQYQLQCRFRQVSETEGGGVGGGGWRRVTWTRLKKELLTRELGSSGPYTMLFCLAHHACYWN